ncbi:metallo-beta-lactamase domain protein [Cooperia oncophora]
MERPSVDQLVVGYAREDKGRFSATGSVTLIRTTNANILVDCGDPWNGEEILQKLSSFGLQKENIHIVVVTHGHIDHCGNLSMFRDAKIYMDGDLACQGKYTTFTQCYEGSMNFRYYLTYLYAQIHENPLTLAETVELRRCSGHTDHDLIVVVSNTEYGRIVVSGDIFECANDDAQWRDVSRYPDRQEKSRLQIEEMADWIVPGHGPMFKNEKIVQE